MRRVLGVGLAALALTGLAGCNSNDENQFVVGMECAYAPYNWSVTKDDASDHAVLIDDSIMYCDGYDVQMAQEIADGLDKELVIKSLEWDALTSGVPLNNGLIDAVIAGMSPTTERMENILFTNAYFTTEAEQVIVVKNDSNFANATSLGDFDGAVVIGQLGTFQISLIDQITNATEGTHLSSYNLLIQSVRQGNADAYIAELGVAETQAAANDDLTIIRLDNPFTLDKAFNTVAIGLKTGNTELNDKINDILSDISNETRIQWMDEATKRAPTE